MPRFFVEVEIVDGKPDLPSTVDSFAVVEQVGPNRVVVETDRRVATNATLKRKNRDTDFRNDHPAGLNISYDPGNRSLAEPLEAQRLRRGLMDGSGRVPTAQELSGAYEAAQNRMEQNRENRR